eukprot:ANDGO_04079.mRNA.1 hypothetical protein
MPRRSESAHRLRTLISEYCRSPSPPMAPARVPAHLVDHMDSLLPGKFEGHIEERRSSSEIGKAVHTSPLIAPKRNHGVRRDAATHTEGVLPGAMSQRGEYEKSSTTIGAFNVLGRDCPERQYAHVHRTGLQDLFKISEPSVLPGMIPEVKDSKHGWEKSSSVIGKEASFPGAAIRDQAAEKKLQESLKRDILDNHMSLFGNSLYNAHPESQSYGSALKNADGTFRNVAASPPTRFSGNAAVFNGQISLFAKSEHIPEDLRSTFYDRTSSAIGVHSRRSQTPDVRGRNGAQSRTFEQTGAVFPGFQESREEAIARSSPSAVAVERQKIVGECLQELSRIQEQSQALQDSLNRQTVREFRKQKRMAVREQVAKNERMEQRVFERKAKEGRRLQEIADATAKSQTAALAGSSLKSKQFDVTESVQNLEAKMFSSPIRRRKGVI